MEAREACGKSFTREVVGGDVIAVVTCGVILTVTDAVVAAVVSVGVGSLTALKDDVVGGVECVIGVVVVVVASTTG